MHIQCVCGGGGWGGCGGGDGVVGWGMCQQRKEQVQRP